MRRIALITMLSIVGAWPAVAELRAPLEKQFFDYFVKECSDGLVAEAKSMNMDATQPAVSEGITKYCSCTSQAVVSYLDAGEIISFAVNPLQEPVAGKIKPYFEKCHGK